MISKVYQKGQITLPIRFRKALGLHPGDEVEILLEDDHLVILPKSAVGKNKAGIYGLAGVLTDSRPFPDKELRRDVVKQALVARCMRGLA